MIRLPHLFGFLAITMCYGLPSAFADPERAEGGHACYAMNADLRFKADRYEKAWYPNKTIPFNLANAFDFSPPSKYVLSIAYTRMEQMGDDVRLLFFSNDQKLLWQTSLTGGRVECNGERTTITHSARVHGGDSFGGSNRVITTTFTRAGDKAHVVTTVQIEPTIWFVKGPHQSREMWAEFARYAADR